MILIAVFALLGLSLVKGDRWCRYDCGSEYGNLYGNTNYGPYSTLLPPSRTIGFSSVDSTNLCDTPTVLSELNHPVVVEGTSDPTFAVNCAEGVKVFKISESKIQLITTKELPATQNSFLSTNYNRFAVARGKTVTFLTLVNDQFDEQNSLEGKDEVSAVPIVTSEKIYAFFGTSVVVLDRNSGEASTFETTAVNTLKYSVLDGTGSLFFCAQDAIVKMSSKGEISKIPIDFKCSHILASRSGHVIVGGLHADGSSSVFDIATSSFSSMDLIGNYEFAIFGISREAWVSRDDRIALLGFHTSSGVSVIVETGLGMEKGAIYSSMEMNGLQGRPTFTNNGEPIIFAESDVYAYTSVHKTKVFNTDEVGEYEDFKFLPNPLYYGRSALLGITEDAKVVLYQSCRRFEVGSTPPEDACPIGELPPVPEEPFWMGYAVAGGSALAVPLLGSVLLKKMKLIGEDDENLDDFYSDEEDSEDERDEEESVYFTPTPISTRKS